MNRNTKIVCERYLDFIRDKPCCVCGRPGPSDPDHLKARGGGSGKRNDFTAVPLCRPHHSIRQARGTASFDAEHNTNLYQEAMWMMIEFLVHQTPAELSSWFTRRPAQCGPALEYKVGKAMRRL